VVLDNSRESVLSPEVYDPGLNRLGLNGGNNSGSSHADFSGILYSPLQSRPHVALALLEQSKRVRVPVDAGPVRKPEFPCNGHRRVPADKGRIYLFALLVGSDRESSLVPSKVHRCVRPSLLAHALIVVHSVPSWRAYHSPESNSEHHAPPSRVYTDTPCRNWLRSLISGRSRKLKEQNAAR
jgi:hypothetical protein